MNDTKLISRLIENRFNDIRSVMPKSNKFLEIIFASRISKFKASYSHRCYGFSFTVLAKKSLTF